MATAASHDIKKKLANITECSVCHEMFRDPRQLPCIHTFCRECIRGFSGDKRAGADVPCPLCRIQFKIPESGVDGLPKNFFVEQLRELVHPMSTHCEVCSGDGTKTATRKAATMFCVDCSEQQCDICAESHSKMKFARDHKLVKMADKDSVDVARMVKIYCPTYRDKPLELYCFDCKSTICLMCSVISHKQHNCSEVSVVAGEFRQQMIGDIKCMTGTIARCREMIKEEKNNEANFSRKVDSVENEICDQAEKLKKSIDDEKSNLVRELRSLKDERNKQIKHVIAELEHHLSFVESLVAYTEQLRDNGTASDVAQQTCTVHGRATELMKLDVHREAVKELGFLSIAFAAAWPAQSAGNVVGQLHHTKLESCKPPTLIHVIPDDGGKVVGVTCINKELFVLRKRSGKHDIQVYDTQTFTLRRTIQVVDHLHSSSAFYGLTSCSKNNCLYVCHYLTVLRIDLTTDTIVDLGVGGNLSYGVSVNSASNILVLYHCGNTIKEYTHNGTLVRTIELQASHVEYQLHSVQLTSNQFIVAHRLPVDGVSIVDERGRVTATYRNSESTQLLNRVRCVAVTKYGSFLLVDRNNHRILLLDPSLSSARNLLSPSTNNVKLNHPECMYLDECDSRLYVGEVGGNRVLIFDNVNLNCLL